jgi:hypothetical protein
MVLLEGKEAVASNANGTFCFVVCISIIYLYMVFEETARLMSIMAMASHGVVKFFHFLFHVVCVGKGFEDEFSDNSDLSFSVRIVF